MTSRVKEKGNECLENIKTMIDRMKNDLQTQKLSLSAKSVEIKQSVANLALKDSSKAKKQTEKAEKRFNSGNKTSYRSKKSTKAKRLSLNHQNSLFKLSMSEEQLNSANNRQERPTNVNSTKKVFDMGLVSPGDQANTVFRLTQSREHFENQLTSGFDLKFTQHRKSQEKIAKRTEYVDQKLLAKLNSRVQKLEIENRHLKGQNTELSTKLRICLDEIDSLETFDRQMQQYILELEEVIQNDLSKDQSSTEKQGALEQKLNEPLAIMDHTVKNYSVESCSNITNQVSNQNLDRFFDSKQGPGLNEDMLHTLKSASMKTVVKESQENLKSAHKSRKLRKDTSQTLIAGQSKVDTESSLFSKYNSKDRFAVAKLYLKIERMQEDKDSEINHRDELIEDLWNEVKRYRKNEKQLRQKQKLLTSKAKNRPKMDRGHQNRSYRRPERSSAHRTHHFHNSIQGVGQSTEELYQSVDLRDRPTKNFRSTRFEDEDKENCLRTANIDILEYETTAGRATEDSMDRKYQEIAKKRQQRSQKASKQANLGKGQGKQRRSGMLRNKAYQQLKILNQTCNNIRRLKNIDVVRKICENDTAQISKKNSRSPKRGNNSKSRSRQSRAVKTADTKLTMDRDVFGNGKSVKSNLRKKQRKSKISKKKIARFNDFRPIRTAHYPPNKFDINTFETNGTQDNIDQREDNYFNFETGAELRDSIDRFDSKFKHVKLTSQTTDNPRMGQNSRFLQLRAEFRSSIDSTLEDDAFATGLTMDEGSLSPPRYISRSRDRKMKRQRSKSKSRSRSRSGSARKYLRIRDDDVYIRSGRKQGLARRGRDRCDQSINQLAKVRNFENWMKILTRLDRG